MSVCQLMPCCCRARASASVAVSSPEARLCLRRIASPAAAAAASPAVRKRTSRGRAAAAGAAVATVSAADAGNAGPAHGWHDDRVWSVVVPSWNRLQLVQMCLAALEDQDATPADGVSRYEVILVDDGSTDGTAEWVADAIASGRLRKARLVRMSPNAGPAAARNAGVRAAAGGTIVFLDCDMVVRSGFLRAHATGLAAVRRKDGDDRAFTYGRVVNTSNFADPTSEPFKPSDVSAAFFATGNVAVARRRLAEASESGSSGPFDAAFSSYGWEDLELGERLRATGARIVGCPDAVSYHVNEAFDGARLPAMLARERARGANAARFFRKHPTLGVRLTVQLTPLHYGLWALLTLGGRLDESVIGPGLAALSVTRPRLAFALSTPLLNWACLQATHAEMARGEAPGGPGGA